MASRLKLKALDAEDGEPTELAWWCERAEAAERYL